MKTQQPLIAMAVRGKLEWQHYSALLLRSRLEELDGQWVRVTLEPVAKQHKTLKQLGYYFAVILPAVHRELLRQGYDCMGVPITQSQADEIIKHYCGRIDGNEIILKRNMSKEQATRFIDNCIRWSAEVLNIAIPEPVQHAGNQD